MKIVTNSLEPGQAKQTDDSALFAIYSAFASAEQRAGMKQAFADGIGWGDAKQQCFELINSELADARSAYEELISDPVKIEQPFAGRCRPGPGTHRAVHAGIA